MKEIFLYLLHSSSVILFHILNFFIKYLKSTKKISLCGISHNPLIFYKIFLGVHVSLEVSPSKVGALSFFIPTSSLNVAKFLTSPPTPASLVFSAPDLLTFGL